MERGGRELDEGLMPINSDLRGLRRHYPSRVALKGLSKPEFPTADLRASVPD